MKISLLHPSRGRPKKSFENTMQWIQRAGCDIEVIVCIDTTDDWKYYFDLYPPCPDKPEGSYIRLYMNDNKSVVEATNFAVRHATGNILIYLSDDFECFDNWGIAVQKEFGGVTTPQLIKVDDCLQEFNVPVLTIPIMNRALYERLGYFWHPDYKSMFVDEDLYWTSKKLDALKLCPNLKFPHNHVSVGKAEDDETYRRSAANWEQGKAVFKKRRGLGFPV